MARRITTADQLEARVAAGTVVLKCMSTQCVRCPAVSNLLTMLMQTHKFQIVDCDVHAIEEDLYEVLQVTQLPTLIIYRAGVQVARADGIFLAADIKSLINDHCEVQLVADEDF